MAPPLRLLVSLGGSTVPLSQALRALESV